MFKHYLTYQFALSFHQLCLCAKISDIQKKNRLLRSVEQMIQAFTKSLHSKNVQDEGLHLFNTTLNLQDCGEVLEDVGLLEGELRTKHEILLQRMEKICESVAKAQAGQLRMLG